MELYRTNTDLKNARDLLAEDYRKTLKMKIKAERVKRTLEFLDNLKDLKEAIDSGLPQSEINRRRKLMADSRQKIAPWLY